MEEMIRTENLTKCYHGKPVVDGVKLEVPKKAIYGFLGPNGAGKSSLSNVLAGKDGYEVTDGSIMFKGQDLLQMSTEERARSGLFLSMQYPIEIPGVMVSNFLKQSLNSVLKHRGEPELDTIGFMKLLKTKAAALGINPEMLKRFVNVGFSGGEKKRFETLQMALLKPEFCILDEIDSGLDIDALKTVSDGVNSLRSPQNAFLVITHYQRLLNHIVPDVVHIFADGRIIKTGDSMLAQQLEKSGYADFLKGE